MVNEIDHATLALFLDDHRPSVCEGGHMVCEGCSWHESFHGDILSPDYRGLVNQWWTEYINHLTKPNSKESMN